MTNQIAMMEAAPTAVADPAVAEARKELDRLLGQTFKPLMRQVETVTQRLQPEVLAAFSVIEQSVLMAQGLEDLRAALTDDVMKRYVMPLMNSPLGFRTDSTKPGELYNVKEVREAVIEAAIKGFRWTGNEFNIISGRAYFTKEGLARRVREWPGLTNLRMTPGLPTMKEGGCVIEYVAEWELAGVPQKCERKIPVRLNNGQGGDAGIGKATRKILAAVFGQLTGSEFAIPEGEVDEPAPTPAPKSIGEQLAKTPVPGMGSANAQPPADWKPAAPQT
jgi:hypothetical protein